MLLLSAAPSGAQTATCPTPAHQSDLAADQTARWPPVSPPRQWRLRRRLRCCRPRQLARHTPRSCLRMPMPLWCEQRRQRLTKQAPCCRWRCRPWLIHLHAVRHLHTCSSPTAQSRTCTQLQCTRVQRDARSTTHAQQSLTQLRTPAVLMPAPHAGHPTAPASPSTSNAAAHSPRPPRPPLLVCRPPAIAPASPSTDAEMHPRNPALYRWSLRHTDSAPSAVAHHRHRR